MLLVAWPTSLLASAVFVLPTLTADLPPYKPCPILGPRYPLPTRLSQWPSIQDALTNLTDSYNDLINSGGQSDFTGTTPNTTTFSVGLFEADSSSNASSSLLYEFHRVAPSFKEETSLDSATVYNIGGVSQVLAVYAFLTAAGHEMLNQPVTKFVSELSSGSATDWGSILLSDLTTHIAGIPRDGESNESPRCRGRWTSLTVVQLRRITFLPVSRPTLYHFCQNPPTKPRPAPLSSKTFCNFSRQGSQFTGLASHPFIRMLPSSSWQSR